MRTFHYLVQLSKLTAPIKAGLVIESRCFYTKRALKDILELKELKLK